MLDEQSGIQEYRTIWISDTHLGTQGARAKAFASLLKYTRSETLYLVGDIVDGWRKNASAGRRNTMMSSRNCSARPATAPA